MPVIVAKELGLYKKAGLDVDIASVGDGVNVFRVCRRQYRSGPHARRADDHRHLLNGAAVKALSANLPKFEASMIVRADIKTMEDLKGKRIGIQEPGGFADLLSRSVLRAAKIDPEDVNFVSIASEDVPALVANQVDTAILHVEQEMFAKSKVPDLHPIARMWELQPKTLYKPYLSATEKTIKDKPDRCKPSSPPILRRRGPCIPTAPRSSRSWCKQTGYPEDILAKSFDFLVQQCIWDANSGLSPERTNFTAELMTKVGNIKPDKTPKYDDIVDTTFAKKAIAQLGEWKGPVCPTAAF